MSAVRVRLMSAWLLVVVVGTLAPFDFGSTAAVDEHSFKLFQHGAYERDPVDFVLNLLLFVPLGILLHQEMRHRRALRLRSVVIMTAVVGLLISTILEYLQQFVPSRDSSLIDIVANTVGSVIGVFAAQTWPRSIETRVTALRARTSPATLVGVLAVFLAFSLMLSGALQARTRLSNWSTEYPLLVGNERNGERPWRGRVFALTITDAATPLASMQLFAAGDTPALPGVRMAAFDFNGTPPFSDATGHLPAFAWTDSSRQSSIGGIRLTGGHWLQTEAAASALTSRFQHSNAFSIRVQCASDAAHQTGLARIVSNSADLYFRNFTLGQDGADLVFLFRTPQSGVNGYPPETIVPQVFSTDRPQDILVTYDGATLLTAVAKQPRGPN